jgi:mannose-6-phosphate isomerase-like protein (cupin superfamily)
MRISSISRRDLSLLLPALAAAQALAQDKQKPVLPGKTYRYSDLPVKLNGQNESRAVFDGLTHSDYPVEMHMTKLAAGQSPHAPHRHVNEEVMMLKNGQLDVLLDGNTTRMTAGSIVYVASMEEHGLKNPGPDPAEYFVIALGPKT